MSASIKPCKYCGNLVPTKDMSVHVRHRCPVRTTVRNGETVSVPQKETATIDPVSLINGLSADDIRQDIESTVQRLNALRALLTVVEARDSKVQ